MADLEPTFWVDTDGDVVAQLVDHAVVLAHEAQAVFAEHFGGVAWGVELGDPARFTFHTDPPVHFDPSFVGSTAADGSWMWGWHNVNQFAESVVAIANTVHENGVHLGVAELTTPLQPLDPDARLAEGLPARIDPVATYVLLAQSVSLHPLPVWFRSVGEGGAEALFLLRNDDAFGLPPATCLSVISALTDALNSGMATDHILALHAYADRRDGITTTHADVDRYELDVTDGSVTIRFDELRRIAGMETTIAAPSPDGDQTVWDDRSWEATGWDATVRPREEWRRG